MALASPLAMVKAQFNKPAPLPSLSKPTSNYKLHKLPVGVRAYSMNDKMAASLIAGVLTTATMVPDVATAVENASGGSSSLKNFLLSIAAGGVVLAAILFAVVGVSNFDPVKRN